MQLDLKKVTFSEALSEDSSAFTADVYLDGALVAKASNSGQGGGTNVQAHAKPRAGNDPRQIAEIKANRAVMAKYEEWAAQQPNTQVGVHDWAPEGFARSLEADVDGAFESWLKEHFAKKDQARLKRMCRTKWVFTLKEHKGKPTKPNALFLMERAATENLADMGKHLRAAHGENLTSFLNEIYG